jgi:membrane protease YdiL (CAAX protease family)
LTKPTPTGWVRTAAIFGVGSALLFAVTRWLIPRISEVLDVEPVIGWFIAAGSLVFAPLIAFGFWLLDREPRHTLSRSWGERLWLRPMSPADWAWCGAALAVIAVATLGIQSQLGAITGEAELSPGFMSMEPLQPDRYWILAAWLPFWVLNILGEEFLWRGVLLPRQEAALGDSAWLANAAGWLLFHLAFGPRLLITLVPIILILPFVVQKRRNTTIGIVLHALLNGPGFLAVALGMIG